MFTLLPEWNEKFEFWSHVAHSVGGWISVSASVPSQWVGLIMVAVGLLYVIFIGEPNKGVQRHPFWPYLAWSVVAICITCTVIVASIGYTISAVGPLPRRLTAAQIAEIKDAIRVPAGTNYLIDVTTNMACSDCAVYASQLTMAIEAVQGWHVINAAVGGVKLTHHGIILRGADSSEKSLILAALN